ncbi:cytochrome P450 [Rhodocollybia butyracea]|uniref:Cytochrome P450 n=1 Tax=Rhodocollybia butyracea TaxID=206335 RepID=A0A9P5UFJ8_9AGAR|nr:cytochrome P450 [Rhodocollybia butyracea]
MTLLQVISIPLALAIVAVFSRRRSLLHNLPPGPPGYDQSRALEGYRWNTFKAWNDLYGPVVSFFIGQKRTIVLGTMEAAVDLLEKRSEIYSNRPHLLMGPQVAPQIKPMQIHESALLLNDLLTNKDLAKNHSILRRYTASLMFYLAYGRRVKTLDDPLCMAHDLRPLQWFRREPERQRDMNTNLYMTAMNDVKNRMQDGVVQPCTTTYGIAKQEELGFNDIELAYALSAPWAAGIGTTTAALEIAILAMLHFPECVRKVQGEIDAVVGRDRLPTFEDQPSLPYTGGFIKETLRWKNATPTGIAHSATEDNTYHGMFIPKGTTVYANAAGISLDPTVFPDPHTFKPERFVETTDPRLINHKFGCFGFGRRICPGMHVALQSLYIVISRMLWSFDVLPVVENGTGYIPGADDFTLGLVSRPTNLKYRLVPRFEIVKELIAMEAERATAEVAAL